MEKSTIILMLMLVYIMFTSITKQLSENYHKQNPYLNEILDEVYECFPDSKRLRFYEGEKSYTLNKEKVFICMKNKKDGNYYEKQVLLYVILHEYTHSICPEIGHTKLFFEMFDEVIHEAIEKGLYDPDIIVPDDYCE